MNIKFWEDAYRGIDKPLIICRDDELVSVVYTNSSAIALLNPSLAFEQGQLAGNHLPLQTLLHLSDKSSLDSILHNIRINEAFENYPVLLYDYSGEELFVSLSGNILQMDDQRYFILYLLMEERHSMEEKHYIEERHSTENHKSFDEGRFYRVMNFIHALAYSSSDLDKTIQSILDVCGNMAKVSRTYVVERVSHSFCRNTYEWCNIGIEPMIDQLQNVDCARYHYNEIVSNSLLADDVCNMTGDDRAILEMQGIQSVAFMPLTYGSLKLGFMGFDDCEKKRRFSEFDLKLLKDTSSVVSSLIIRRDAQHKLSRTLNAMQTVTDNLSSPILVNTLDTHEVLFANNAMLDAINRHPGADYDNLVGHKCYSLLRPDSTSPCPDCPLTQFKNKKGEFHPGTRTREFYSDVTNQWFLVKDSIIEWTDGQLVHLESSLDITRQKKKENKFRLLASTDTMTGAYTREWGHEVMADLLRDKNKCTKDISIAFLDIDGLKKINDTLGHSVGDDMITQFVNIIRSNIRKDDLVIRWGGDEFLLLLYTSPEYAEIVISNIQKAVEENNTSSDNPYQIHFSYGISRFYAESISYLDEIISMADRKMYLQKKAKYE